jgi:hypothetical protein
MKYVKYIKQKDLKKLVRTTRVVQYIKNRSDNIKWIALKENAINALFIDDPTEKMINFIKNDNRFSVKKITSKSWIYYEIKLKNKDGLNINESLLYNDCVKANETINNTIYNLI